MQCYRRPQQRALLALALAALALCAVQADARVVLVGVDGGSWNVLDPMLAAGELPNLAAIAREGVTAELETVEPVSSPVVWTSIATGRTPEHHGVTDFFSTALAIRVPTVFERLAARGLRVGLYDYLMTWPPVNLPGGFVIPGWLRRDESVTPPDVWSRIDLEPWVNAYDTLKTNEDYRQNALREVARKASRWNALADAFDIEVGAVTYYAIDGVSHRFWHGAYPDEFTPEIAATATAEERAALRDALRALDEEIGEIRARMSNDDTILIASDHGFEARKEPRDVWVSHFEDALELVDLDPVRDGFSVLTEFQQLVVRIAPGEFAASDETARRLAELIESHTTADGRGLYWAAEVLDVAPRPAGSERSILSRLRQWVIRRVLEVVFGVALDPGAHAVILAIPRVGVLEALAAEDSVKVAGRARPFGNVFSRQVFTGSHHEIGIFLAAGGPILHVAERSRISVLDIAPLIFQLAHSPIPDDLEGRVPVEWISPRELAVHAVESVPASTMPGITREAVPASAATDRALREKLRRLGYLE